MDLEEMYQKYGFREIQQLMDFRRKKIQDLEKIVNRANCPCCHRVISREETKQMIIEAKKDFEEVVPFFQEKRVIHEAELKVARTKLREEEKQLAARVEVFFNDNKSRFTTAARMFNKREYEKMLPQNLSKDDQMLWNKAFEGWCTGSVIRETEYMDNETFYF